MITINTDASFHPKLKYGAYAFWAVCEDFKILKSGVFRKKCINSDDAEAKCIINALTVILKAHTKIKKIIVNTDSLNAIAYLSNDKYHVKRYRLYHSKMNQFSTMLNDLKSEYNKKCIIEFRHVKAHSTIKDKRSYVNEWCDREAKKQMRKKTKLERLK